MPYDNERDAERRRKYAREYSAMLHREGRSWAKLNPEKVAAKRRRRTLRAHGLTPELWQKKFEEQGKSCAICGTTITAQWHTDHCHSTGKFRGILCKKCNNGIGQLQDSPEILRSAADYIESHKEKP